MGGAAQRTDCLGTTEYVRIVQKLGSLQVHILSSLADKSKVIRENLRLYKENSLEIISMMVQSSSSRMRLGFESWLCHLLHWFWEVPLKKSADSSHMIKIIGNDKPPVTMMIKGNKIRCMQNSAHSKYRVALKKFWLLLTLQQVSGRRYWKVGYWSS